VSEKWFVCSKDLGRGIVYVAAGTHHPALYTDSLRVSRAAFNWIGRPPPEVRGPNQIIQAHE
jgi:tRNA U34 2-thiouridine synthase MnmA/TrmU